MYRPDPQCADTMGKIAGDLASAQEIENGFLGPPRFVAKLASGELYFDTALELDTDGWPQGHGKGDPSWQPQTSLCYGNGSSLDANKVPYFVLPLPKSWAGQFRINLGDYAAVICKGQVAFAVFGDQGPHNKLGEGSIQLLRALGHERIKSDGHVINAGIDSGVVTIVFPGSGAADDRANEAVLLAAIETKGKARFAALSGAATPPPSIV
jgi:glycosyl hydrolase group 75 (putative chitosanase)